jgi:hypothetical protein
MGKSKGGDISLSVGNAKQADGGNMNRSAGSSAGYIHFMWGGMLDMISGESDFFSVQRSISRNRTTQMGTTDQSTLHQETSVELDIWSEREHISFYW